MRTLLSDYTLGAAMATDLVNSSPVVRGAGETLTDPAALGRFLADRGLESRADRTLTRDDLESVLALRTTVRAILETTDEDEVVTALDDLVGAAATGPALRRAEGGEWQWYTGTRPGASVSDELAVVVGVGLLGVVRHLGLERFRACGSPTCQGVFVDISRAGRRRYCMPDRCGNRINVANHRARARAAHDSKTSGQAR